MPISANTRPLAASAKVEKETGGERVIVYYLAEGRIDFRQLVKNLAKEFQTRIEMKQIGVRDEAKMLGVAHAYQQATDWHARRPGAID